MKKPFFSSCNGGGGNVKNGRLSEEETPQATTKKSKNDNNAVSASPIPREPFDLAQLKAYGKYKSPVMHAKFYQLINILVRSTISQLYFHKRVILQLVL